MRADMREKITFKQRSATQNEYGEELTWTNVTTVWASLEPLLGNEFFVAARTESKVEVKFRCHYYTGLTDEMRITHNNIDYEILSLINYKNLNRELLVYAKKVDA